MKMEAACLPWNHSKSVDKIELRSHLNTHLPPGLAESLPTTLTLYCDHEVSRSQISRFLEAFIQAVEHQVRRWRQRAKRFVELDLLSQEETDEFLLGRRSLQPWVLYYSKKGGLGLEQVDAETISPDTFKVITCTNLDNHGVAWRYSDQGGFESLLVTARKKGGEWDWDADVGHELAHATFCQVPVFSDEIQAEASVRPLHEVGDAGRLEPVHLARIAYHFSEIPVATMIEEVRETETTLPIDSSRELLALLALCHDLMPGAGFDRAFAACQRVDGRVSTRRGSEAFEVSAPIMRVLPALGGFSQQVEPPELSAFRNIRFSADSRVDQSTNE